MTSTAFGRQLHSRIRTPDPTCQSETYVLGVFRCLARVGTSRSTARFRTDVSTAYLPVNESLGHG